MTVFFLNATSFGTTIGDLWEFCGLSVAFYKRVSTIILQKSSARKVFVPKVYLRSSIPAAQTILALE